MKRRTAKIIKQQRKRAERKSERASEGCIKEFSSLFAIYPLLYISEHGKRTTVHWNAYKKVVENFNNRIPHTQKKGRRRQRRRKIHYAFTYSHDILKHWIAATRQFWYTQVKTNQAMSCFTNTLCHSIPYHAMPYHTILWYANNFTQTTRKMGMLISALSNIQLRIFDISFSCYLWRAQSFALKNK